MNVLDLAVIAVIAVCVLIAYNRGLIRSVFNLLSWVVSIALANYLYPPVSRFLRTTGLYTFLKASAADSLGLDEVIVDATSKVQAELISNMYIPDFIKSALFENNNPEIYKILDASGIEDYIAGYMANIFLNIISVIAVFIIVFILMRVLASALDIISKLPVINTFNKIGGIIVGFFTAAIIIWIFFTGYILFIHGDTYLQMSEMIYGSIVAKWFYQNNVILKYVLKVVA